MKLDPITLRAEYAAPGDSGMRYTIIATQDDEWGWGASISVSSFGCRNPHDSVQQLIPALEDALAALRKVEA